MAKRDIIVVGASAGGVIALTELVKALPSSLDASIFIVLHTSPYSPSLLPKILSTAGTLNATHALDGQVFEKGKIYIAPPDHHLLLERGSRMVVKKGPKENLFRPSVDALFRSAAYVYGPRVIGIILSGLLDDGTSGMWTVKRSGGLTILQSPEEAQYSSMPMNVLQYVDVNYITTTREMGALLATLVLQDVPGEPERTKEELELLHKEVVIATHDHGFDMGLLNKGELTTLICPDCQSALLSITEGQRIRFRCQMGHAYSASTLLASVTTAVEEKLWQAMHMLEETKTLLDRIGDQYSRIGNARVSKQFKDKAAMITQRARFVHESIFTHELLSEDQRFDD